MRPAEIARPIAEGEISSTQPDFDELFRREFDYVWFTLRRLGVFADDLEDVTHDVFVLVYRNFDQYDASRPIRPWLFGFAYRAASAYRRLARHRSQPSGDLVEVQDEGVSAIDQLETQQLLDVAQRALNSLDLDRRAVFVLHDIEGCTIPEVASVLRIPLNTAYSRLRLARADFAKAANRLRGKHER
jgi:RNA polymerase sigma-70 factor (ECF subfamily)